MSDVTKTCRDINELSPVAQKACRLFLQECKKEGLPVLITETYRSQARQNYLYEHGRTRPGNVVTWTRSSRHTGRMAWDICKNLKGHEYSDQLFFKKCGEIAKRLGITWGGTWKTPDKPHFEVTKDWKYEEDEMVEKHRFWVEGKAINMDRILKDNKNFVELRDIADAFGFDVVWDGKEVHLTKKK